MDKNRQAPVTEEEIQDCEVFEQLRNSYHMTQKEWATAVGISYGLVKAIEQHTIKCSPKTKAKVHSFEIRYNSNQDAPDLYGLEAHILYDVLLSHMEHISMSSFFQLRVCVRHGNTRYNLIAGNSSFNFRIVCAASVSNPNAPPVAKNR